MEKEKKVLSRVQVTDSLLKQIALQLTGIETDTLTKVQQAVLDSSSPRSLLCCTCTNKLVGNPNSESIPFILQARGHNLYLLFKRERTGNHLSANYISKQANAVKMVLGASMI